MPRQSEGHEPSETYTLEPCDLLSGHGRLGLPLRVLLVLRALGRDPTPEGRVVLVFGRDVTIAMPCLIFNEFILSHNINRMRADIHVSDYRSD